MNCSSQLSLFSGVLPFRVEIVPLDFSYRLEYFPSFDAAVSFVLSNNGCFLQHVQAVVNGEWESIVRRFRKMSLDTGNPLSLVVRFSLSAACAVVRTRRAQKLARLRALGFAAGCAKMTNC